MNFVVPDIAPPTDLQARAGKLTWDKSFGAVAYMVQRSEQSGGPYETVGIVQEPLFVDDDVDEDTEYYYVVYALIRTGMRTARPTSWRRSWLSATMLNWAPIR